jgi:hypothetical protein
VTVHVGQDRTRADLCDSLVQEFGRFGTRQRVFPAGHRALGGGLIPVMVMRVAGREGIDPDETRRPVGLVVPPRACCRSSTGARSSDCAADAPLVERQEEGLEGLPRTDGGGGSA